MSSWDRVRFVPWTRIEDVSGKEYEDDKERVFRSLQREATKQLQEQRDGGTKKGNKSIFIPPELMDQKQQQQSKTSSGMSTSLEFSTPDLVRSIAFGSCVGSITGAVFGFMDGMRSASESSVLKNASNSAKSKYLLQGTTRAGAMFGVFFGGFHAIKYGIRVAANEPGDITEIACASVSSMGLMMIKPVTRASMPYAAMLIAMDSVSIYLKEN